MVMTLKCMCKIGLLEALIVELAWRLPCRGTLTVTSYSLIIFCTDNTICGDHPVEKLSLNGPAGTAVR